MATAHFITAPIRCRTRRAVSGLSCQIGVRIAKTSAVVTADTGSAPMRGNGIDAPICQDSRSGSQVGGLARSVVCHHALKDLAGEKAFETADDLPFGPPFSGASFDVVEGW